MSNNLIYNSKLTTRCFALVLTVLLCYAPAFAEENIAEKNEVIEEFYVVSTKKTQRSYEGTAEVVYNYPLARNHIFSNLNERLYRKGDKLFLLYLSLKLCD